MWRCYRCESFNNSDYCFICGLNKNAPVPAAKPAVPVRPTSNRITPQPTSSAPFFRGLDETYMAPEKKRSSAPYIILAIVFIILIIMFIYMNS